MAHISGVSLVHLVE